MSQEGITKDNMMIAKFMKLKLNKKEYPLTPYYENEGGFIAYPEQLKYHTSWDWLMPVAKKIIPPNGWTGDGIGLSILVANALSLANIELAHKRIINFILWYNGTKKQ